MRICMCVLFIIIINKRNITQDNPWKFSIINIDSVNISL